MASTPNPLLTELGLHFRRARRAAGLSQEQVALRANISRPRYRDIETGAAAARATTLVNVARALGMEMMLIPQAMVPAILEADGRLRWRQSTTCSQQFPISRKMV